MMDAMDSYYNFSYVYDLFMDETPYDTWTKNVINLLADYGLKEGMLVDLGCGTGQMTKRLYDKGFSMIGVDLSEDMLTVANGENQPGDILYICKDMRELELHGTVNGFVSFCDSLNYIQTWDDLKQVFSNVSKYLGPGGMFVFDMNTPYKYETLLADHIFSDTREEGSFIWENEYDPNTRENIYDLTLYIKGDVLYGDGNESFFRFFETHIQHCYTEEEVKEALSFAGLSFIESIDADTMERLNETSERMYFVAKKN